MARTFWSRTLPLVAALLFGSQTARGDSLHLTNGEVLKGKVLTVDESKVTLESESLGKVTIERKKVATITFGDAKPPVPATDPKVAPPMNTTSSSKPLSVEDAFKQLKSGGANPKDVSELQKLFPELSSPEASKYFNDTIAGVMSGKKGIDDIRKDAIKARDDLLELTKDLGPDVEAATRPYLNVLEKFIRETEPKKTDPKTATPPAKK